MFLVFQFLPCILLILLTSSSPITVASAKPLLPPLDASTLDEYFPRTLSSNPYTSAHSSALRTLTYSNFSISFPALMRLNNYEHDFYKFLKYQKDKLTQEDELQTGLVIQRYIDRYEEETLIGVKKWSQVLGKPLSSSAVVTHPFLTYKMLRRLTYDFPKLYKMLMQVKYLPTSLQVDLNKWPSPNDVFHMASLLVLLHFFYDFYAHNFGRGTFGKIETGVALTANHLMELHHVAFKNRCYASALELIEFALSMTRQGSLSEEIEKMLKETIQEHDKLVDDNFANTYAIFTKKIGTWQEYVMNPRSFITRKYYMKNDARVSFKKDNEGIKKEPSEATLVHRFMMLCKGEYWQTNEEKAKLKCWNHIIYNGIYGFKIELLSENPNIFKVHDFIKEKARAEILQNTYNRLKISKKSFMDAEMASKAATSAFLSHKNFSNRKLLKALNKNIAMLLNWNGVDNLKSGNPIQITCFTPGGHHSLHLDRFRAANKVETDVLNTRVIIYLNSVQAGGRTAFPRVGISVKPSPGSAIIWNNYQADGRLNDAMEYGECPVVLGLKWITDARA